MGAALSLTAATSRHVATLWHGNEPWNWLALYAGHEQPRGHRTWWRHRRMWKLHLTPLHVSRDGDSWTLGVCFGARTLLLYRHR